jgi:hypothetical protein
LGARLGDGGMGISGHGFGGEWIHESSGLLRKQRQLKNMFMSI